MNNSIKLKRRWLPLLDWSFNHCYLSTFDYHYVSFKTGNVVAFKLDANVDFNCQLQEALWNLVRHLVPQHFSYRLDYNGCSNKYHHCTCWLCLRSLPSWLVNKVWSSSWSSKWYQQWPLWLPSSLWPLYLNALNHSWFLIFLYVGGGIPMNAWTMKGYFDTVPMSLDESAKLDSAGRSSLPQPCSPTRSPNGLQYQAMWAFMGPFGDYNPL